jgi:D-arabinose 1-dehydrogenase-like Zn-dependent alcohol dehydrogenase
MIQGTIRGRMVIDFTNQSSFCQIVTCSDQRADHLNAIKHQSRNIQAHLFRRQGRVVAVGLPPEEMSLNIPRLVLDGIQVVGSLVGTQRQ